MFVRVDKDFFINVNTIISYKLTDDYDAYKLIIKRIDKTVSTVYYMKDNPEQMEILLSFNNAMQELVINPEKITDTMVDNFEGTEEVVPDERVSSFVPDEKVSPVVPLESEPNYTRHIEEDFGKSVELLESSDKDEKK